VVAKQELSSAVMPARARKPDATATPRQRRQRAARIVRELHALYPTADCALAYGSPFQLLVATILSAQCTDTTVNQVTPEVFGRYPDPAALAAASQEALEKLIYSTGFFRNKAKNLRAMAKVLGDRFGGEVPRTMAELLELPGVARKTANVVLGTAFGIAEGVVVDTHVARLSGRLGLSTEDDPVKIERDLIALLPKEEWVFAGHALIWHGRRVCDARKPRCAACTLLRLCPEGQRREGGA
jgi:endonuclease-3